MLDLKQKPKAIITGIDKIITNANSWFEFITELKIDPEKHRKVYNDLKSGQADWTEVKYKLFDILTDQEKKIHRDRFANSIGQIEISGDAISTVRKLQDRGYRICLISGSIDLIVESMANRLGIEDWYANTTLHFDDDGYWKDIDYNANEDELKKKQAEDFLNKHDLKPEECLVLGHSNADVELFKMFSGIAIFSKDEELDKLAKEKISYFPRILQILQKFE